MITANKGEWSEIYALFKLLSDGQLFGGDEDLNKIESLVYPIIKILRHEANNLVSFSPEEDDSGIIEIKNGADVFQISAIDLKNITQFLLNELQKKQTSTFAVPEVEKFMDKYNSKKIKAKSSVKSDIRIVIHDERLGTTPELGFSIKSRLGEPSTLLNAGKTTNFVYEIKGLNLTDSQINQINEMDFKKPIFKNLFNHLKNLGATIEFSHAAHPVFRNNLILLDSLLPEIMGKALYKYYISSLSSVADVFDEIANENPMQYSLEHNHPFYKFKIKKLLCETAIGMMPGSVWTGDKIDSTGGYLIVKEDGDVVCYHLYHRHEFEEYLYKNTKFETASRKKHDFGYLFENNGKLYISLNLQIRFK
jgi:type II restriction enzyme